MYIFKGKDTYRTWYDRINAFSWNFEAWLISNLNYLELKLTKNAICWEWQSLSLDSQTGSVKPTDNFCVWPVMPMQQCKCAVLPNFLHDGRNREQILFHSQVKTVHFNFYNVMPHCAIPMVLFVFHSDLKCMDWLVAETIFWCCFEPHMQVATRILWRSNSNCDLCWKKRRKKRCNMPISCQLILFSGRYWLLNYLM